MEQLPPIHTDVEVLREMIRLAENRRNEELAAIEGVNKYNLALIGFAGGFLSLLVTATFPKIIVQVTGFFLLLCIGTSFLTIRPRILKNGSLKIDSDVMAVRNGAVLPYKDYLLAVGDLTNLAATAAKQLALIKRRLTIISAIFLACALLSTYILYSYA
jgi:hypothetical protein